MKRLHIFGHPLTVSILFCLLLVSGKHIGGFYLVYLLLALPHGALYAVLAFSGVILVLGSNKLENVKNNLLAEVVGIVGGMLMVGSLVVFFEGDRNGYNEATFRQAVPIATYCLFSICLVCFFIRLFYQNHHES